MDLKPGDKLGHFEILSLLGEGGMGVVYKARDPRLDRMVAIKLLTEARIPDPDRRARFMQEARAASALNHPGIVTIHDIAEQDGRHYIVMEFVDGKPLNERIPRKGMGLTEGLRLSAQIADALAAAHAAGIVHRDIKPANIMVDTQGRTKVLDFGLAKLTAPTVIEAGDATRTMAMDGPRTEEGAIVGSVPYMSPEQVEGRALDARSDIFSFGAVLYEMFTGQRAFRGDSRISTLAAVMQHDPPPAGEVAPAVPTELERVISRCLRKDVARRSQNMSDVKLALEELRDESESGKLLRTASGISAAAPARRRWLWPAIAAACVVIAGSVVGWVLLRHEASVPPSANLVRVSPDDGYSYHDPAISADGKFVAFISDRSGTEQLWLRQLGGGDPVQLTHSADSVDRAEFFPDGTRLLIATWSEQKQKIAFEIVPMLGGQSRVLLAGGMGDNEALSPDGHQVSYVGAGPDLTIIPVETGAPQVLEKYHKTQPHMSYSPFSSWMPDGRALIVSGTGHPDSPDYEKDWDWFALPVDGGDPAPVGAGTALRAARLEQPYRPLVLGDRIVFADGSGEERTNVWQIQFDPKTPHVTGTPRQLTFGTEQEKPFSVSQAGTVAIESSRPSLDFYLLPIDFGTGQASGPARRLTQDGRYKLTGRYISGGDPGILYFGVARSTGHGFANDRFALDLATPTSQQRLLNTGQQTTPEWQTLSPDGLQTAYSRADGDSYSISLGDTGSPPENARPVCSRCGRALGFSPDARYLSIHPKESGKSNFKYDVSLLELASKTVKPWLEDPTESVQIQGFLAGAWVIIRAWPPDADASTGSRYYLAPWRPTPIPRSEWVEFHPPPDFGYSPTAPFIFGFQGSQLVAMRFDEKQQRFGEQFSVRIPPGSATEIRPADGLNVRGPGIVFARRETNASVWLMKLPPE